VLAEFTVDTGFHGEPCVEIDFVGDDGADGAECIEALGARPLAIFLLQIARRDVVGEGVAPNVRAPVGIGCEPAGAATDDEGQFAFKIHAAETAGMRTMPPGASRDDGGLKKRSGSAGLRCQVLWRGHGSCVPRK